MDHVPTRLAGQALATIFAGEGVTHVIFILDRSGSMSGKEPDVIGGFNSYIDTLRESDDGDVGVRYLRFDNALELVWNDLPVADVPRMTHEHYQVRGNTALLDAVGMTVSSVKDDPQHQYIVITNTDGEENASHEWTAERVRILIAEHEGEGQLDVRLLRRGRRRLGGGGAVWLRGGVSGVVRPGQYKDAFLAKARVSNVMRKSKMRSTRDFARATRAVMDNPDVSDNAVEEMLKSDGATDRGNG